MWLVGSAAELSGDIPRAYIGNNSDSEYHFNVLRQWLVDCQSKSHFACNTTISGDVLIDDNYQVPLPSRLISVGFPGDEMVYLRETKGENGAYITLSYVRGGSTRIPTTTSDNIVERRNGILVSSLPKTFQDVITIARKLNVPYVWIDALCIIQDDEEDWNREVGQMARIYQFSLLTVAATGAEDASKGCFLNRVPSSLEIGPVINLPYRTKEGVVSGRFTVVEQHTTFAEEYDRFVEKSPLLKRGWIFQERVLSRRMVHYTRGKMFLECRSHRFRDECQEGVSKDETQLGFWGPEIKGKTFPKKDPNPFEATLLGRWYIAVKIYSQLRLTKTSDKLAAVAGVASEFQMLLSKERDAAGKTGRDGSALHTPLYVSGLWSHDLLYGLSWCPSKPQNLRIAGNNAPSWSWASWHTPIEWPGITIFKPECRIIVPEMLEQYRKAASSHLKPRQRIKSSQLSTFEADLPRGIILDTTMSFLSELEVTGKIRDVWRRPQKPGCLTIVERKEFSDSCEMSVEERHWLQYCQAVYVDDNAVKPVGYGCFEDHWLLQSVGPRAVGTDLNGGLSEADAIALSLKDNTGTGNSRPNNSVDGDLELAIAASLGKVHPQKATPKQVDLDEEFNDQLAIALMLSAEEYSKSKTSNGGMKVRNVEEDAELATMLEQAATGEGATRGREQTSSLSDSQGEASSDSQPTEWPPTENGETNERGYALAPAQSPMNGADTKATEELIPSPQTTMEIPSEVEAETQQHRVSEEVVHPTAPEQDHHAPQNPVNNNPALSKSDFKGKQKSPPVAQPSTSHQPPQIPSRTSSKPQNPISTAIPDPQSSTSPPTAIEQPLVPAKLHYLPLYSTRATGSLSYVGLSPTVYTVLFLREAGERDGRRVFERVGVGKIIERGFFGNARTETVVLV